MHLEDLDLGGVFPEKSHDFQIVFKYGINLYAVVLAGFDVAVSLRIQDSPLSLRSGQPSSLIPGQYMTGVNGYYSFCTTSTDWYRSLMKIIMKLISNPLFWLGFAMTLIMHNREYAMLIRISFLLLVVCIICKPEAHDDDDIPYSEHKIDLSSVIMSEDEVDDEDLE